MIQLKRFTKQLLAALATFAILFVVWVWIDQYPNQSSKSPEIDQENEFCIQVVTPARNPQTGEIREFPTPCDVPEGWEVIQNTENSTLNFEMGN